MSLAHFQDKRFAGIAYSEKEGLPSQYLFSRSVNYRDDPTKLTILPRTIKSSGSVVVDLPMWGERQGTDIYVYGNAGHIYKRDSLEAWTDLRTVSDSHGNGLRYFGEDGFLYYTNDKAIGRYGPMGGTKTFTNDFLGAEGGVPLNTHSLVLVASSSQYATAADSASLSQTSDISLELSAKFTSLPAVGSIMAFMGKWNQNSDERSYTFEILGVSGFFGDAGDGSLTISTNTTNSPIDSSCSGTAASYSLTATNASFANGQKILIHQSRGSGGKWERNEIASYTAGTITLANMLTNTYIDSGADQAQVLVLKEYSNVTVNAGVTWTAKAWDGNVGGILAFLANGTLTVNGTISGSGKGFRGGAGGPGGGAPQAYQGESYQGTGTAQTPANYGAGGGGAGSTTGDSAGSGGGGAYATAGTAGMSGGGAPNNAGGAGGGTYGAVDLNTAMYLGSGGGGGGGHITQGTGAAGGPGGGAIFAFATTITLGAGGSVISAGSNGSNVGSTYPGGGGGASGGSILLKAQTATLGSSLVTAAGGAGGTNGGGRTGGTGGDGRIHLDYYTSYTGTTSPTLDATQDETLVTNTSYQLRLGISSTGVNEEFLTKTLASNPNTAQWYRFGVTWDASASTATFYVDGSSAGQSVGSLTSIYNSTALFAYGARFNAAGAAENFLDGKIDDGRLFNTVRTANEMNIYKDVELTGTESGLQAYHQLDNALTDSTVNANTLTLVNAPAYDATDVPFSSPTARNDLDKELNTSGQTYTVPVAISETVANRQTFVPAKDPQKSVEVLVAVVGSGDWTLTVHDGLNRVVAEATITNANLRVGDNEFIFSSPWRPVLGASYHFHLNSTVADGTVTTTTNADFETVDFHTYYQFLVTDVFHPIHQHGNKLAIGNERYVATWDASTYSPHAITLPSGYRVRALGTWRDYLTIGVTRGTNITDYSEGKIFFWDGTSTTYNFFVDVPQGGINAILSGDTMYFVAGYSGDFMKYEGGKPRKILRFPKMTGAATMEVYPGGLAMWHALVHLALAGDSDSTTIEKGVYSYGSLYEGQEETLSYDYPLSPGVRTGTDVDVGMVFDAGQELLIGWRNGSSYGVDSVSPDNAPFPTATIEFLIRDAEKIWAQKQAQALRGYFKAISSGDSFNLKYKIDRESNWNEGTAVATAAKKEIRLVLPTKGNRFNELQYALDMATTNSISPEFYGVGVEIDTLSQEKRT